MTTIRQNYQMVAAIAFVVGVALITVAEMSARLDWLRAFAAGAITLGALGVGVYVGLTHPGRYAAAKARLAGIKQPFGIAILILLFVPSLAALVAGVVGIFNDPDGTGWVVLTGAVVLMLMLIATAAAFAVGIAAVMGAGTVTEEEAP